MINADAIQKMKYKHCLESLNLSNNDFDFHQLLTIWYVNLFSNLRRLDMSDNNNPFNQNKVKIYGIKLDNTDLSETSTLVILNISCINVVGNPEYILYQRSRNPINCLTLKGIKDLQIIDLAYSSLFDCNYTINGLQNVDILNISHFKCGLLNHNLLQSAVNLEQLIMESSSLSIGLYDDHRSKFLSGLKRLQYIDFSKIAFKDRFRISTFKSQLDSLQSLILEGNLFTSIPLALNDFNRLSLLNLRNNKMAYLTTQEIDAIDVLL
ncbi:unnamed protein product [Mytilus edulis]|uniref:Uncharacterized protein n=1 Tax=Mytilus edulis TaxID=6550 RepID=A0A8S3VGM7_MYTED|nr:unnamed protein product [Mytilus edulis]